MGPNFKVFFFAEKSFCGSHEQYTRPTVFQQNIGTHRKCAFQTHTYCYTSPLFGKRILHVSQQKHFFPMGPVYCLRDSQLPLFSNFFLKLGPTALFTHLKIILL